MVFSSDQFRHFLTFTVKQQLVWLGFPLFSPIEVMELLGFVVAPIAELQGLDILSLTPLEVVKLFGFDIFSFTHPPRGSNVVPKKFFYSPPKR